MNKDQVISYINSISGFRDTTHKTSFTANRKARDGSDQEVHIDIFDSGTEVDPQSRYACEARTKDGRMATGNPASSVSDVLLTMHWHNLDQ
jgi:hypothetical protein